MKIVEVARKGVLTKSNLPVSDFSANPYVGCTHGCVYCYASFMKRFTNHAEPWGEFLDVKQWPEIKNPEKYAGKDIFISSVTDPYNPQEATYRRARALLEQLKGVGVRITIQTKSDLVLRDIDLIRAFPNARVGFSINTLDEAFKDDMDRAPSIARRMDAMKALHDERIRTTCFISPIFPGITDVPAIVERVRQQCNLVWLENLNLRGSYKAAIMEYIASKRPGLLPLYEDIYVHGRRDYWEQLDVELRAYAACHDLDYVRDDDSLAKPFDDPPTLVNFFYHEEITKSAKARGVSRT